MKKLLFLFVSLFAVQVAMADEVTIASFTFSDNHLAAQASAKSSNASATDVAGISCTVDYSKIGGWTYKADGGTYTANSYILNGKYYHKLTSNDAYIKVTLNEDTFKEGDKFTATMSRASVTGTDGFFFKNRSGNSQTISYVANSEVTLEYTLVAGDINDDGSITIYRYSSNCYVRNITVWRDNGVVKEDATTEFTNAYWGFARSAGTNAGQTVTTNSTGAVTYSSSNTDVVTVNEETGALTAEAIGKAVITANVAGDDNYYASSANYTVYVLSDGTGTWANPYLPTDFRYHAEMNDLPEGTKAWVVGYIVGVYNSTEKDVKIVTTSTTTSSSIGLGNTSGETVGKNCLSVQLITATDPRLCLNLNDNIGMLHEKVWVYGKVGTFTASSQTVYGLAHADYFRYGEESLDVTIDAIGYATFSAMRGYALPEGMDAYTVSSYADRKVTLKKIDEKIVPAFTGVILKGTSGTLTANETEVSLGSNSMKANLTAATIPSTEDAYTNFILVRDGEKNNVLFGKVDGTSTLAANKAYLQLPTASVTSARELSISFDDGETTSISEKLKVKSEEFAPAAAMYNLAGQRVAQPTKGLYIVNGKKYIVK